MRQNKESGSLESPLRYLLCFKEWQKIQDKFSAVTGVNIRTIDAECSLVTEPSMEPRLCRELIKDPLQKEKICGSCLPTFLGGKEIVDKNLSFSCNAGLCNFVAPLRSEKDKILGYVILGPVILVKRKSKEEYRNYAEELNIDLEDFWSAILEIKVLSFQGVQSMIELIKDVGEYTIEWAHKKLITEKEAMKLDLAKLRTLLNDLFEVAFEMSKADIGSVMSLDEKREELTIKSSRGIPDEIARKTKIRFGEGISGIAAQEGKSFLIDEDTKDNRIRPYLSRPYIGSSMVIPLKVENRVVGVMNLGALKTSVVRFNADNVHLINKLIDLVSIAIKP